MKYIREEHTDKHTRHLFALGKEEAEILTAALENAYKYTPKLTNTEIIRARTHSMYKEIKKVLNQIEVSNA